MTKNPYLQNHQQLRRDVERQIRSALAEDRTTGEDAVELLEALADQLRRELERGGVALRPAV